MTIVHAKTVWECHRPVILAARISVKNHRESQKALFASIASARYIHPLHRQILPSNAGDSAGVAIYDRPKQAS
jgi:hypothetical protein